MISAREPGFQLEIWRISFLRSHETFRVQEAPLRPLLVKELWEILGGRALWTMLLLLTCPLIGYSFFQAISLYGEASAAGLLSPVLASSLSPLDGVLVPTFGASYVAVTLRFPFVAIRALGQEKESGALRLLIQLPYRSSILIVAKLVAVCLSATACGYRDGGPRRRLFLHCWPSGFVRNAAVPAQHQARREAALR